MAVNIERLVMSSFVEDDTWYFVQNAQKQLPALRAVEPSPDERAYFRAMMEEGFRARGMGDSDASGSIIISETSLGRLRSEIQKTKE